MSECDLPQAKSAKTIRLTSTDVRSCLGRKRGLLKPASSAGLVENVGGAADTETGHVTANRASLLWVLFVRAWLVIQP